MNMLTLIKTLIIFSSISEQFLPITSGKLGELASNIFCSGKLLHHVQMARIYNDSKYFVDMKLKFPPKKVKEDFIELLNETNNQPGKNQLKDFIKTHFDSPESGVLPWLPSDWKQNPDFIHNIYDGHLRQWAKDLHAIWKKLGKVFSEDVRNNSPLYSQLYVPYPFIVPGGRFREFYYWDSYWIIEGLYIAGMHDTAKNMLRNFLYLVNLYGYVPNGGRIYYLNRSQPPLLIPMMALYLENKGDVTFLKDNIILLEKEFNFWMKNRSVKIMKDGIQYRVFQYKVTSDKPRPEAYYEDVMKASKLSNTSRPQFFSEIKSGTESGWDFSSRWFLYDGRRTNNFIDIHTSHLAPVCLNSILGYNAKLLSFFFSLLNNSKKNKEYVKIAETINKTISRVFWAEEEGMWFDYNIKMNRLQKGFYPSNLIPLWAETYGMERDHGYVTDRVLGYLERLNVSVFPGGIPTSLHNSTQQWDWPNGWAPLQYFIVLGLNKIGIYDIRATNFAYTLAKKWIMNCYNSYYNSSIHLMYEKYDVIHIGKPGGGGEYSDQEGFGWTNGVALKFLSLYGHRLKTANTVDLSPILLSVSLFIISTVALINYIHRMWISKKMRRRR